MLMPSPSGIIEVFIKNYHGTLLDPASLKIKDRVCQKSTNRSLYEETRLVANDL